jgi:hypothetical protein
MCAAFRAPTGRRVAERRARQPAGGFGGVGRFAPSAALEDRARLLETGAAEGALDACDTALALWRGLPYLGVPDADWMLPVRGLLEEARQAVAQHRVRALLQSAQPERSVGMSWMSVVNGSATDGRSALEFWTF